MFNHTVHLICDEYLKIDEPFIILEYDGTYWHDEKYDELRNNNLSIIKKEIEYAINDIKSKKCKKKCIYKS